jgi:hypothetical protein
LSKWADEVTLEGATAREVSEQGRSECFVMKLLDELLERERLTPVSTATVEGQFQLWG